MKWILFAAPVLLVIGCTESAKPAAKPQADKPLAPFELALKQRSPELLNRYWAAKDMAEVHCHQIPVETVAFEREQHAALCSAYTALSSDLRELGSSGTQSGQLSEFGVVESRVGGKGRQSLSLVHYKPYYVGPFR